MTGYKSLDKIVEQISFYINQLNSGKLSATDIDSLLYEVQQLQERLIILRYKAFEGQVDLGQEKLKVEEKQEEEDVTTIQTPIAFSMSATVPPPQLPDPKQVSLIDVINEALQNTPDATTDLNVVAAVAPTETVAATTTTTEIKQEIKLEDIHPDPVDGFFNAAELKQAEPVVSVADSHSHSELAPNLAEVAPAAAQSLKGYSDEMALAERLQKTAVGDLSKAIPLGQKFVFINELFNQNADEYHSSLDQLNKFDDMEEAMIFIKDVLMPRYNWNREQKTVETFLDLVERRFI